MNSYSQLAKQAVERYVQIGEKIEPPFDLPKEFLETKGGVFVTIFNGQELRGCIGTYLATNDNLAQEIIQNAISAATADNRFSPITKDEFPDLRYEVSILSPPQSLKEEMADPKKYGILVSTKDGRSGLLLPDLEGVNTFEEQKRIACEKGGIDYDREKDGIKILFFTTEKHKD